MLNKSLIVTGLAALLALPAIPSMAHTTGRHTTLLSTSRHATVSLAKKKHKKHKKHKKTGTSAAIRRHHTAS